MVTGSLTDQRKREIAHALGTKYLFYGKEKIIALELHPLLVEVVKFARGLEPALELTKSGSKQEKTDLFKGSVPYGGP